LYRAADDGDIAEARLLIADGAPLELRRDGDTPLMKAAHRGHLEIVQALVDAGADLDAVASCGMTAYDLAVASQKTDVALFLRTRGAPSKVEGLRAAAKSYARRYAGKAKHDEARSDGLPPCVYVVAGSYRGGGSTCCVAHAAGAQGARPPRARRE
jgi:hypothetical protein